MGKCNRDRFNSLIWKDWNGAPGRTRTCDPLLRRQVTSFFQLHCFHPFPRIINNLGNLLSLSQQPHSLPNIGF